MPIARSLMARNTALAVTPGPITGLEWLGGETGNTQRVLRWLSPFAIYDATYIFRCYPKGPKSGATNPAYWTLFFWGNYGNFKWKSGGTDTGAFYGAHPYPFAGTSSSSEQDWEISTHSADIWKELAEGSETVHGSHDVGNRGGWNRWYTLVFRAWKSGSTFHHELIYDWDLFISSSGANGWFEWVFTDAGFDSPPPTPSIVVGQAPPNDANTASWGDYLGREEFKGIVRGMQFYDALLGSAASPTVANTTQVASEIATPGSVRTPWYLKRNPKVTDLADENGSGHNPSFPASTASDWTGP